MKPVILHVLNELPFFFSHRKIFADACIENCFDTFIAAPPGEQSNQIEQLGYRYIPIALDRWSLNPLKDSKSISELYRLYKLIKPNLVHHITIKPVLYGSIAAKLAKVPAVVNNMSGLGFNFVASGMRAKLRKTMLIAGLKFAFSGLRKRIIFANAEDRDLFLRLGLVATRESEIIAGSGVDNNLMDLDNTPSSPAIVVLAARMIRDKGIYDFVQAARILKGKGCKARFVLLGPALPGNPSGIALRELESWNLQGEIEWHGQQDRETTISLIAKSKIVCLPSYREGCSKFLLEGLALGKPIVTCDVPGCRNLVIPGSNGFLVPARDANALALAISRILENEQMAQAFSIASRNMFRQGEFSNDAVVKKTLAVYEDLLGGAVEEREVENAR